jgi:tRNA (cytosine38-C5)-methyltransferase
MKRARSDACTKPDSTSLDDEKKVTTTLSYIDFFSGVGGWTTALHEAAKVISSSRSDVEISLECCAALDHSDLCMSVYRHNNNKDQTSRFKQHRIEHLTLEQLNDWKADVWLMSPPCQPHTRQHSNQANDLQDARSVSFLRLVDLLNSKELQDSAIPSLIFLENVIGFEESKSASRFRSALASRNYLYAHFKLQPTQVDFPNDRPRFYCIAVRNSKKISLDTHSIVLKYFAALKSDTSADIPTVQNTISELEIQPEGNAICVSQSIGSFIDKPLSDNELVQLKVPHKLLNQTAAWCFDIVTPQSHRSACFTSGYGRFVKGTGSVLYSGNLEDRVFTLTKPEEREFQPDWAKDLDLEKHLRYFSGVEMARLLGFPESFTFPPTVTLKQQWKLMGNSLNVRVASKLIELGLRALQL